MKLTISKTEILKRGSIDLTTGMIGKTVEIEFAPDWDGLSKFAVFRNFIDDETPVVKENPTSPIEIPVEVLQKEDARCYVGFYGYKIEGGVKAEAIPTIYTDLAIVKLGTDPAGNPTMDVPPSVAEQLVQDMTELGGRVDAADEQIADHEQRIEYLEEHGGGGGESYDDTELRNRISTIEGKEAGWNAKQDKLIAGANITIAADGKTISATGSGSDTSIWQGKTASFYGDSLTERNGHYTKGYHDWIKEILGLASFNNYGVSGYKISDVYNKVNSTTDNPDLVCVMCGVNDQTFSVPLGQMGDTGLTTTYGALDKLCALLKTKYATKRVLFITPHYQTRYPHSSGITSLEIGKAIKEVCEKYAIPVYDNLAWSEFYPTNFSVFTNDNCHWNNTGHELVGKNLAKFINDKFRYIYIGSTPPTPTTYTVTNNLTNCTNNNSSASVIAGSSYSATITANEGYQLNSVSCTMGGASQTVSGGVINIANVTGNIIITASATVTPTTSYSVTNNLTNCANSNVAVSVEEGESYSATITPNAGYSLDTVNCTMGGVAQSVVDGVINIASVTGDIVITATASADAPSEAIDVQATIKSAELQGITHIGFLVQNPSVGTATTVKLNASIDKINDVNNQVNVPWAFTSINAFNEGTNSGSGSTKYITKNGNAIIIENTLSSTMQNAEYLAVFVPIKTSGETMPFAVNITNASVSIDGEPVEIVAVGTYKKNTGNQYAEITIL